MSRRWDSIDELTTVGGSNSPGSGTGLPDGYYGVTEAQMFTWNNKQDRLTFDEEPIKDSSGLLTSGVMFNTLTEIQTNIKKDYQEYLAALNKDNDELLNSIVQQMEHKPNVVVTQTDIPLVQRQDKTVYAVVRSITESPLLYSFCLIADTHVNGDGVDWADSVNDFTNILTFCTDLGINVVCNLGDVTYDGRLEDLQKYQQIKNNFPNISLYHARGNHDINNASADIMVYEQYIEPNGLYFEQNINGDVFLFVGLTDGSTRYAFSADTIAWLSGKLEEHKDKARVFIAEHMYITDTCGDTLTKVDGRGLKTTGTSGDFISLIAHYPNTIVLTAHSHLSMYTQDFSDNVLHYADTTGHYIHTPSLAYSKLYDPVKETAIAYHTIGQCWIVDVHESKIVFHAYDNNAQKYLPQYDQVVYTKQSVKEEKVYVLDGLWGEWRHSSANMTTQIVKDLSGNNRDFVMHNFTEDMLKEHYLEFNRVDEAFLDMQESPIISNESDLTVEFYGTIDNSGAAEGAAVVSIGDEQEGTSKAYLYRIGIDAYKSVGYVRSSESVTPTVQHTVNQLHHFVFTVSVVGAVRYTEMYLDGELFFSYSREGYLINYNNILKVGTNSNSTKFAKMHMKQLRIYNRKLTENEIQTNYNYCM